jgi:transposase
MASRFRYRTSQDKRAVRREPVGGPELEEERLQTLKCPRCGLEDDRDRIAVLNIEKRGLEVLGISGGPLTTPTAPQMTDVGPSRLRNRTTLKRALALHDEEEVSLDLIDR